MILEPIIIEKLAGWRFDKSRETQLITARDNSWTASLCLDGCDRIGCTVFEIGLSRSSPVVDLEGWAKRVAERVTGLHEPLSLVELDAGKSVAQIRSSSPTQRGEQRLYYELLLCGRGEASIRRYRAATTGNRRTQVPFNLTHEVLAHLVEGVAAAV